ncbi:MAG: carboxypeptidase-like regulatory domain-containing protein [Bacteroidota bacterium]
MLRPLCKTVFLALFALWVLPSFALAGETGKISGKVIDQNTREPIVGANVFVDALWINGKEVQLTSRQGATTDIDGNYFILALRPGEYNVTCSILGYGKKEVTKVTVFIDRTTEVNFELLPVTIQSQEVVVTAYKPGEVEKDLTATKQTYNISEVENIAGINSIADILTLQADVIDNHFRGGREGEAQYLISGGTINNPLDASRSFEPMTNALQTVEVLTSGFSAEYGNAQSGVINMIPKEGGDKWISRIDLSMDVPHYRTWGGNPYSKDNFPLYNVLTDPEQWLVMFYDIGIIRPYFDKDSRYGSFVSRKYPASMPDSLKALVSHSDSLRAARFAIANWKQATREIGSDDNSIPEHKLNIIFGGPLSGDIRLFVAAQQEKGGDQLAVPTAVPTLNRQFMSNFTFQLSSTAKMHLLYVYNYLFGNNRNLQENDYFERILQNPKTIKTSQQLGLKFMQQLSSESFAELNLQMLSVIDKEYPEFLEDGRFSNVDAYLGGSGSDYSYVGTWSVQPLSMNNLTTSRTDDRTTTFSLDGSYSAQTNANNFLKTGIQLVTYNIDVNELSSMSDLSSYKRQAYVVHPYEGALYVQDKMEFQGLIANVGLRFDFYDFNYNYFSNMFNPLANTSPDAAPKSETKPFGRLQPRLGVSFPVLESTVFHFNYGTFVQRPAFKYTYGGKIGYTGARYTLAGLGNAALRPEKTSAWDIGIVHALPGGLRVDLSAYYKDVTDLIEQAIYQDLQTGATSFTNYTNIDYATVKGFVVSLDHRSEFFRFHMNYNYGIAKGKSSGPVGQPIHIYFTRDTNIDSLVINQSVGTKDILVDYDRTHRLLATVGVLTPMDAGPTLFGTQPLSNINVTLTFTFNSGRPYSDPSGGTLTKFNLRSPNYYDLKMRVQKSFMVGTSKYTAYVEGYNLLNFKEYSYDGVFDQKNMQDVLLRWNDGERESLVWYNPKYRESVDREIAAKQRYLYSAYRSIFDNQPIYFRIGLWIEM